MKQETIRIGQVAERAGVNVQTLRYYERRGLLAKPRRLPSGYRTYSPEAVRVVRFIKNAQELGFTLHEIQELIRLREARPRSRAKVRAMALVKIEDVDEKTRRLWAIRDTSRHARRKRKIPASVVPRPGYLSVRLVAGAGFEPATFGL